KARREAKLKRIAALHKQYGPKLQRVLFRTELQRHAKRAAKIERMKQLAEEAENAKLLARVTEMEAKETARHEAAMARIDAKLSKPGTAASGASAGSAAAPGAGSATAAPATKPAPAATAPAAKPAPASTGEDTK